MFAFAPRETLEAVGSSVRRVLVDAASSVLTALTNKSQPTALILSAMGLKSQRQKEARKACGHLRFSPSPGAETDLARLRALPLLSGAHRKAVCLKDALKLHGISIRVSFGSLLEVERRWPTSMSM